jgi:hypothetical protein
MRVPSLSAVPWIVMPRASEVSRERSGDDQTGCGVSHWTVPRCYKTDAALEGRRKLLAQVVHGFSSGMFRFVERQYHATTMGSIRAC